MSTILPAFQLWTVYEYHSSSISSVNCAWISSFQHFICELCMTIILPAFHLWTVYEYHPSSFSTVDCVWVPSFQHFICELCMSIIFLAFHLWTVHKYHPSSFSTVDCVWVSFFQHFICELCMNIILLAVHPVNCSPSLMKSIQMQFKLSSTERESLTHHSHSAWAVNTSSHRFWCKNCKNAFDFHTFAVQFPCAGKE
jgi:hypothetical protein